MQDPDLNLQDRLDIALTHAPDEVTRTGWRSVGPAALVAA